MLGPYDVRKLPEAGETIKESLSPDSLGLLFGDLGPDAFGLAPATDGEVSIQIRAVAGASTDLPAVRITGHAKATIHIDCVRCLTRLERPLQAELELTLFPETAEDASGPKGKTKVEKIELSARDLDEGCYRGFELDLPGLVREALLLEVDMNPTCEDTEACEARVAALAGQGGKPEAETAEEGGIDPRWAPLQKFRLKSS